jgi:hypothetical protein
MFREHQPQIAEYAIKSPDNMCRVMDMVSLSIQQPWHNVGTMLKDVDDSGIESKYLFGSKRPGFEYIRYNKHNLYNIIFYKKMTLEERLLHVAGTPGLGLPKAGFVLQLCTGKVGCLDGHNLNRFGLSPNVFKLARKVKYDTALKKAHLYIKTLEDLGGCEYLWNSWCVFMADKYPNRYRDADHVSQLHVDYVVK